MTKFECLKKAEAARHEAKLALARHAMMAYTFGGAHKLAQDAMMAHDVALEAFHRWMDVAQMHPKTRASLIRKHSLPVWMFGY